MAGIDCLWLVILLLKSQKGEQDLLFNFMTDVYHNPILPKPWSLRLFSIDYSPVLKLTQPDLVLWYSKVDSD